MIYFDADVQIGKYGLKHRLALWKTQDILKIMDECGISAALVYSGVAADCSALYGNEWLYREIKDNPRLFGCYTVIPNTIDDFPEPDEMIEDMRKKDMVAARIFPASYHFSTDEEYFGGYLSALENASIPLLVHAAEITDAQLETILKNHPRLNVVLQRSIWDFARKTLYMLKKHPNLYVDMSNMQANCAIEYYPSEKVVFGSALPKMSAGAARSFIDYARLAEKDKIRIASGNLERLCGVKIEKEYPVCGDYIAKLASRGEPMTDYVFDSHTHVMENGSDCGGHIFMYHGGRDYMDEVFRLMGVDDYVVAPWLGIWTDAEAGNEIMVEMNAASDKTPRAHGYVLIDPNYTPNVREQAEYYHNKLKIPGLKMFYSRTGICYDDPVYDPWWEIANENHLFILLDSGSHPNYLETVERLAVKYPNVTMFLDHAGRSLDCAEQYARSAKKNPNVYLQITFTSVAQGVIEYLCNEGMANRTLYGTDAPMRDARPQLGWVAFANISVEDKRKILGENMREILNRCFKK